MIPDAPKLPINLSFFGCARGKLIYERVDVTTTDGNVRGMNIDISSIASDFVFDHWICPINKFFAQLFSYKIELFACPFDNPTQMNCMEIVEAFGILFMT